MATETQYRIFKEVYDEETERYSDLEKRSNLYFTIISFYLGAVVFKFDDLLKFAMGLGVSVIWFLVIGAVLVVALLLTVLAVGIRTYEGIFDPEKEIESLGKTPPSDSEFLDRRLVDLAVATNRNSVQNDKVASALQWAARSISVAVLLQFAIFGVVFAHAKHAKADQTAEKAKTCQCAARQ